MIRIIFDSGGCNGFHEKKQMMEMSVRQKPPAFERVLLAPFAKKHHFSSVFQIRENNESGVVFTDMFLGFQIFFKKK